MALPKVSIVVDDLGMESASGERVEFLVLMKSVDGAYAATALFDGRCSSPYARPLDWRALPVDDNEQGGDE